MSIWTEAKVTQVYIDMGKFKNDQNRRFVLGSFQIVEFDHDNAGTKDVYIKPCGTEMGFDDLHGGANATEDADLRFQARNGWGYMTLPQILEWHSFGNNQTDSLLELHYFGPI